MLATKQLSTREMLADQTSHPQREMLADLQGGWGTRDIGIRAAGTGLGAAGLYIVWIMFAREKDLDGRRGMCGCDCAGI